MQKTTTKKQYASKNQQSVLSIQPIRLNLIRSQGGNLTFNVFFNRPCSKDDAIEHVEMEDETQEEDVPDKESENGKETPEDEVSDGADTVGDDRVGSKVVLKLTTADSQSAAAA